MTAPTRERRPADGAAVPKTFDVASNRAKYTPQVRLKTELHDPSLDREILRLLRRRDPGDALGTMEFPERVRTIIRWLREEGHTADGDVVAVSVAAVGFVKWEPPLPFRSFAPEGTTVVGVIPVAARCWLDLGRDSLGNRRRPELIVGWAIMSDGSTMALAEWEGSEPILATLEDFSVIEETEESLRRFPPSWRQGRPADPAPKPQRETAREALTRLGCIK